MSAVVVALELLIMYSRFVDISLRTAFFHWNYILLNLYQ